MKTESKGDDRELRERLHRMDGLIQEVEAQAESAERTRTKEIVRVLMEFHGAGIERMLERIAEGGREGQELIDSLAQDDLVSSLLLLYGLHPLDLESRVRQALEKVEPYIHSHGGNVELIDSEDGIVRLRLQGSCHGCPSSAVTLRETIEEAIREKAPEVVGFEVEGESGAVIAVPDSARVALPILAG